MREDGNVRRRWVGLLRPPGEPWWAACLVVVVGVAVAVALYLGFEPDPHPVDDALLWGVLLPGLPFLLVAWLAVEMRSSVLGIIAAATASGLALAAAWDATINGTGSTAALAILAAPPFMVVCGVGVLVIEQVARALADRSLGRARPPAQEDATRRRRRVGLAAIVGLTIAGLALAWNEDPFEDAAARAAGAEEVRCEPLDYWVACSLLGPSSVVLAESCGDAKDALVGCELADPLPTVEIEERWWTAATALQGQGFVFQVSIAVDRGAMGRWGSSFRATSSDGRFPFDWVLLVGGGRAADPSSERTAADEIIFEEHPTEWERDFEQGTLVELLDGSTLWTRKGLPDETRDRIAAAVAYS